jgi:hypothetical protein
MEVVHWEASLMLDCRASTFSAHLNTEFRILQSSMPWVNVELVEVAEKGASHGQQPSAASRQERFSIVFRGPRDTLLQQGTYQLQHTQLGALELFLVPVGQDHAGLYYEAVFNRLRRPDV